MFGGRQTQVVQVLAERLAGRLLKMDMERAPAHPGDLQGLLHRDRADIHAVQVEQQLGNAAFRVARVGRDGSVRRVRQTESDLEQAPDQGVHAEGVAERGLPLQVHDPLHDRPATQAVLLGKRQQVSIFLHVARHVLQQERRLGRRGAFAHEIPHGLHQDRGPAAGFRSTEDMRLSRRDQQEIPHLHAFAPLPDGLDAAALAAVEPFIFIGMHMLTAA